MGETEKIKQELEARNAKAREAMRGCGQYSSHREFFADLADECAREKEMKD